MRRTKNKKKILFLCTGNSCRSIMAEAILRQLGGDKYQVFSAGSKPAKKIHPLAVKTLEKNSIPTHKLRSKSWDEYIGKNFDIVITVCSDAAKESCPYFPGVFFRMHWNIPDPAKFQGTEQEKYHEFLRVFRLIKKHMNIHFSIS